MSNRIEEISRDVKLKQQAVVNKIDDITTEIENMADFVLYLPSNVSNTVDTTISSVQKAKVEFEQQIEMTQMEYVQKISKISEQISITKDFVVYLPSNISANVEQKRIQIMEIQGNINKAANNVYRTILLVVTVIKEIAESKSIEPIQKIFPVKPKGFSKSPPMPKKDVILEAQIFVNKTVNTVDETIAVTKNVYYGTLQTVETVKNIPQSLQETKSIAEQRIADIQRKTEERKQAAEKFLLSAWDIITLKPVVNTYYQVKAKVEALKEAPIPFIRPAPAAPVMEVVEKKQKQQNALFAAVSLAVSFVKGVISFAEDFQVQRDLNRERYGLKNQQATMKKKKLQQPKQEVPLAETTSVTQSGVVAAFDSPVISEVPTLEVEDKSAQFGLSEGGKGDEDDTIVIQIAGRSNVNADTLPLVSASMSMRADDVNRN
eukprot:CAMPEP_0170076838 /NCGR_PEP_ID=MMETSP0019_2-20121128/13769_1 /TAXON_ID=98059 /ORGANISM="Dinobryon sp., Strain UTEXLB2267" /LENGTH=432 /DNA_ID=CAMNT_0010288795 /DNA_START=187 /DNA_END=1485 /DNA_ORIENTATION=+